MITPGWYDIFQQNWNVLSSLSGRVPDNMFRAWSALMDGAQRIQANLQRDYIVSTDDFNGWLHLVSNFAARLKVPVSATSYPEGMDNFSYIPQYTRAVYDAWSGNLPDSAEIPGGMDPEKTVPIVPEWMSPVNWPQEISDELGMPASSFLALLLIGAVGVFLGPPLLRAVTGDRR